MPEGCFLAPRVNDLSFQHSLGFWWAKGHPILRSISWHSRLDLHELRFFEENWASLKHFACVSLFVISMMLG